MAVADSQEVSDLSLFGNEAFIGDFYETFFKTLYNEFITEALDFYSENAKSWKDSTHDPLYDLLENEEFSYFTKPARQAVVTLAYLFRGTYRRRFNLGLRQLMNIDVFLKLVLGYSLNNDEKFLHFLTWIAYLFELTLYCKIHKIDFEGICKSCFSNYPGLSYFQLSLSEGLEEVCNRISGLYFPLVETFPGKYPSCDISLPFKHAVGIVDREFKYDVTLMKMVLLHGSVDCDYENLELKSKFHVLSSYNQERITLGYRYRNKIKRQDEIKKLLIESSEIDRNLNLAEETQECIEASLNASSRKVTPIKKSPLEFDDARSFVVVTDRYLLKRQEARHNAYESEFKRDIKLFPTYNWKMELAENLMNVLDENIEKNNLYEIADGVFAVYPLNSDCEDFDDKIIVLDTSSSDDDDDDDDPQLDLHQREFKRRVIPVLRKWKYCISNDNEQLKRTYEIREEMKHEVQFKPPRYEVSGINMQSTEAIPKEMDSTEQIHEISKKKKRRSRKKKQKERKSMEITETKAQQINSIESNFETTETTSLLLRTLKNLPHEELTEFLSLQNKLMKNLCDSGILENPERVLANTLEEEISSTSSDDEGENIIWQYLEKSKYTVANAQKKEISFGNTGAITKKQKPFKDPKNTSKQSSKKYNTPCETIRPGTLEDELMKAVRDYMEEMKLISATSTGAKEKYSIKQIQEANEGYRGTLQKNIATEHVPANTRQQEISATSAGDGANTIGQNLQTRESTVANAQQEEISNQNAGAIPKKQKPSKEPKNASEQSSAESNTDCQIIRPETEDNDAMKSMGEMSEQMELISLSSTGAKENNSIKQILEECMRQNTLEANRLYEKLMEKNVGTECAPANTRQEEISALSTGAKGKISIGQILEESESTIENAQQEEISKLNTGAIPKKRESSKEHKISPEQSSRKSYRACKIIRPGIGDKDLMESMVELMERIRLFSVTSTGAKGKNYIGQNLEKSESTNENAQQEEISNRNTGAIPKKQESSKEHKISSEQSSEKSNPACQTIGPVVGDKEVTESLKKLMEKIILNFARKGAIPKTRKPSKKHKKTK